MPATPEQQLRAIGETDDEAIDIARAALLLAALDRPNVDLGPYEAHLAELAETARAAFAYLPAQATSAQQADCLAGFLAGEHKYRGDSQSYDDMKNADLISVIDRRQGLPVTLGVLYLHAGRAAGLDIVGLNFPGHFVLRISGAAEAAIVDPFNGGARLTAADLRQLIQGMGGPDAALVPEAYAPVSPRDILLRLQNNILNRALKAGDTARGLDIVTRMVWIAPAQAGLRFEQARLATHLGNLTAAAEALERCVGLAKEAADWQLAARAAQSLDELRRRLN